MTITTKITRSCDVPGCTSKVTLMSVYSRHPGWSKGSKQELGAWTGKMHSVVIDLCPKHKGWKEGS